MEKAVKIDVKQREHIVDMLWQAERRAERNLEKSIKISEASLVNEAAKGKGLSSIVKLIRGFNDDIINLQKKVDALHRKMEDAGFRHNGHDFELARNEVAAVIRESVEAKLEAARQPIEDALKKYRDAVAQVWTVSSPDELRKAIDGLL
jgi:hypothetical protein